MVAAGLLLILASPSKGQGIFVADSVQRRNDCRLAEQVVATGAPSTKAVWARSFISECLSAVPTLVNALRQAPAGSAEEEAFITSAAIIHDDRILEAAAAMLEDRGLAPQKRLAAIRVLGPLLEEATFVDPTTFADPSGTGVLRTSFDRPMHVGEVPIRGTTRTRALAAIARAGTDDPDPTVRRVAASLTLDLRASGHPI
ncbi:MAG: hypothetical protein H0T54_02185 [Geodermatophilaceae bacterium]|nr:hypothetical protein [Geodermatophilaceae bacterium]